MIFRKSAKWNFSLIELLIVVAVLGIVMSLLMPAVKRTLSMANMTVCQSNMKSIGVAYALYPQDEAGWLVRGGNMVWGYELRHYLNLEFPRLERDYRQFKARDTVLECPSTVYEGNVTPPLFGGLAFNTYYMGAFINHRNQNLNRKTWNEVSKPEETLVIGDAMNPFPNNPRYHLMYQPSSIPWHERAGFGEFVYTKHNQMGLNIAWVDGHVSYEDWHTFKLGIPSDQDHYYRIQKR